MNEQKWTIRGLRYNFGLSAEEVAKAIYLPDKQSVQRYERNSSKMSAYNRERFADFYGVPVEDIAFGKYDELKAEFLEDWQKRKK